MLKAACSQYFFFALLLVAIVPSTAWTENERVETRTVRFEEIFSTGDDVTVELELDQPIRLESWIGVIVDTVRLGLERTSDEGRASVAFGMALLAGGDVAHRQSPVVRFSTDLPNVSMPLFFPFGRFSSSDATVDRVRVTLGLRDQEGTFESWLRPFPEVGVMTLHFFSGNVPFQDGGRNEVRSLTLEQIADEWTKLPFDEPVDGEGLAYVSFEIETLASLGRRSRVSATVVSELVLDDGFAIRLDDVHSPSTGEPAAGVLGAQGSLLLGDDQRCRLFGAKVVSWQYKLVASPGGVLDLDETTRIASFGFIRDFRDRDGNGRHDSVDVCVARLFQRGDSNSDGQLDLADPIANLTYQFLGQSVPCIDALDFDDSGEVDITDPIANLAHQFLGGPPPAPPGKESCGVDPTDDEIGCDTFARCP